MKLGNINWYALVLEIITPFLPTDPHTLLCIAALSYHSLLSDGIESLGKD